MKQTEVNRVIEIVCGIVGVPRGAVLSRRRTAAVAWARQLAMSICHHGLGMTTRETGRAFGRDRTDVRHAWRTVSNRVLTEKQCVRDFMLAVLEVTS